MDNLTHTIVGVALAQAGLNRYARTTWPTWLLILGANGPDIDVFAGFSANGARYLEVHRGWTHSFVGAPVLAATAAVLVWLLHRKRRSERPYPWAAAFGIALVGVLSHLLLDFITPYGTRLLLPFSRVRYSWDLFSVVDLWLTPLILLIMLMPFFFGLISSEIGARKISFRPAAIAVFVIFALLGAVRFVAHNRALSLVDSYMYRGREPVRSNAYPDSGTPFLWHVVIDTGDSFEEAEINLFQDFDPTATRGFYPPEPNPAIDAARHTRVAQAFLDFAEYPYIYAEQVMLEEGNATQVVMRDLRYEYATLNLRKGAVARILLDPNMHVISEKFTFRDPGPVR